MLWVQLHNRNHTRVREACQETLNELRLDYLVRPLVPAPATISIEVDVQVVWDAIPGICRGIGVR